MEHHSSKFTLAIDPGTRRAGVALFEDTKLMWALSCDSCKTSHATLVYENPQMFRIKGGLKAIEPVVRMAGMLSYWGMRLGFRVCPYQVTTVKAGITGRRSASKEMVEGVMHKVLDLKGHNRADHEYDAMSVAVYHLDQADPGCFGIALPMQ